MEWLFLQITKKCQRMKSSLSEFNAIDYLVMFCFSGTSQRGGIGIARSFFPELSGSTGSIFCILYVLFSLESFSDGSDLDNSWWLNLGSCIFFIVSSLYRTILTWEKSKQGLLEPFLTV